MVLLVRHGATPTTGQLLPGRARGLHLSELGAAQAQSTAERIASLWEAGKRQATGARAPKGAPRTGPDGAPRTAPEGAPARAPKGAPRDGPREAVIYASPLERAQETARPIAKILGIPLRTLRTLTECDFGEWTGRDLADLRKLPEWDQVQRCPSRFRFPSGESFASMQLRMSDAIESLVEEHRGSLVVAVSHADTIKAALASALGMPLDLFQRIVISPCSVSAILYGSGPPAVLTVNSTTTLDGLGLS